jgi:hypothetical protein
MTVEQSVEKLLETQAYKRVHTILSLLYRLIRED